MLLIDVVFFAFYFFSFPHLLTFFCLCAFYLTIAQLSLSSTTTTITPLLTLPFPLGDHNKPTPHPPTPQKKSLLLFLLSFRPLNSCPTGQPADSSPSQLTSPVPSLGDADSPEDKDNAQLASEPTSIAVPFVSTQFATLTWKPPNQIGTSQILNYTVFWKEDGSER